MSIKAGFIVPHPPLIIPEIGRGEERQIQKTIDAYDRVGKEISKIKPDTIIITTPHSTMYSDYIHISPGEGAGGNFSRFGHRSVSFDVSYDEELARDIVAEAEKQEIPAGFLGEQDKTLDHGVMIPLHFINKYYNCYEIIRISIAGISYLDHFRLGQAIGKVVEESGKSVVFIASGDLSHMLKEEGPYGYREEGPVFDREVTDLMKSGDLEKFLDFDEDFCDSAGECGLRSFIIMAGALDGINLDPDLLSYEGPFGVGYAVAIFVPKKESGHVALARKTLETYILDRKMIQVSDDLPDELINNRAGVFVTLYLHGELRGCIGTIFPTQDTMAEEIINNTISAAFRDPRFYPVTEDELEDLVYSVDVLGEPETIFSIDSLDPKEYGVIVSKGRRTGLLLPNIEGVDTAEMQVSIALDKAGISPRESYEMERFKVVRHS